MGLLTSMLNLSSYAERSRVEMDATEKANIQSATITEREGDYGKWRTLDITTIDGQSLSGVMSPKCNFASGPVDVSKCKIFLTKVAKKGAPDSEAINRWVVE